jgi:hypothetical protein
MAAIASSEAAAASHSVDIDLTLDSDANAEQPPMDLDIDPALGGSADKPIELDLDVDMDISGIFGPEPSSGGVETLFSPPEGRVKAEETFPDFSAMENTGRDIFQSIDATANQNPDHQQSAGAGESLFDLNSIDLASIDPSFLLTVKSGMTAAMDELFKSDQSTSASAQGMSGGSGG